MSGCRLQIFGPGQTGDGSAKIDALLWARSVLIASSLALKIAKAGAGGGGPINSPKALSRPSRSSLNDHDRHASVVATISAGGDKVEVGRTIVRCIF